MGQITAEERRLIDEALELIPAEKRRVPMGASAFYAEYRWNGSHLIQVGGVDLSWRNSDGAERVEVEQQAAGRAKRRQRAEEDRRLDAAIAESIREDQPVARIKERHQVGSYRVSRVARDRGLTIAQGGPRARGED